MDGGGDLVNRFFLQRLKNLSEDKLTVNSDLDSIQSSIDDEFTEILQELEQPCFAFERKLLICSTPSK
jgi:hypothetical protein